MDPLELRIVAPSALKLPAPIPWPSPPKGPWPSTPKPPPGLTFTTLPNERNKEAPCNSPPVSTTPPTRGAPAREPATRTAVVPAERRKAAARSKRSTAESPAAGEAEEEGVRKSMRRWRRGKRERRGNPTTQEDRKNFWAGLAMRRLIKSSCRARSTPLYLIRCETTGEPGATRSLIGRSVLTGASLFVVFALHAQWTACVM